MRYLICALIFLPGSVFAVSYNLENQYNIETNVTGPWSAGSRTSVIGPSLTRFNNLQQLQGFRVRNLVGHHPAHAIQRANGVNPFFIQALSSEVGIHPGQVGEVAVVRFTAPTAGQYLFAFDFELRDSFAEDLATPADVGAYVLVNGSLIDSRQLTAYPQAWHGSLTTNLAQGGTFEISIDDGLSNAASNDWTRVQVVATAVPEPISLGAMALGLAFLRRRKR